MTQFGRPWLARTIATAVLAGCNTHDRSVGLDASFPTAARDAPAEAATRPPSALYLVANGPDDVTAGFEVHALAGGVAFVDDGVALAEARGASLRLAFDDLRGAPVARYLLDPRKMVGRWPGAAYMMAVQHDVTDASGFGVRPYRWTGEAWTPLRPQNHYHANLLGPVWMGRPLMLVVPLLDTGTAFWVAMDEADAGPPPPPFPKGECPRVVVARDEAHLVVVEGACEDEFGVWLRAWPDGARQAVPGLEHCWPAGVAARGPVVALLARCDRKPTPTLAVFDGGTWSKATLPPEPFPLYNDRPAATVAVTSAGVWVVAGGEVRLGPDADHLAVVSIPGQTDAGPRWLAVRVWPGAEDDVWIVAEDANAGNIRPQALFRSAPVDTPITFSDDVFQQMEEHFETFPSLECSFRIVDLGAYSEERAAAARKAVAPLEWFKRGSSRLVRYPWRGEDRLAVQPGVADDPRPIERATHALDPKRVCRHPAHPQVIGVP